MLQKLRDRVHGLIAGVLFSLLAISFVFWGISSYLESYSRQGPVLATVGDYKIHQQQLDNAWAQAQRQGQVPSNLDAKAQQALRASLLSNLIDQAIGDQSIKALRLQASQAQITQIIAQMPAFQQAGSFSKARFQQLLQANNMSEQDLIASLQQQVVQQQMQQGLFASNFILPMDLQSAYSSQQQQRSIRYLNIPHAAFMSAKSPSSADINTYFTQHAAEYRVPARVKLSYVVLSPKQVRAQVKVSAAQVQQFYTANPAMFRVPQRWQVLSFSVPAAETTDATMQQAVKLRLQVLEKKSSFKALAKQYPGEDQPAWLAATQLSAAARSALQDAGIGEMTSPVVDRSGRYTVYQLLAKQSAHTQSLTAVQKKIRQQLLQSAVSKQLQAQSEQLSDVSYTHPDSLQPVAKALQLQVQNSAWLQQGKQWAAPLADSKVQNAAFSDDVLQQGNNSRPLSLADGSLLVLRVAQHQAAHTPALAAVRKQVVTAMQKQQAMLAAQQAGSLLQQQLLQGKSVTHLLSQHHLVWQYAKHLQRDNKKLPVSLVQAGFNLFPGKQSVQVLQTDDNMQTLVQLLKVYPAVAETKLSSAQTTKLQNSLQQHMQRVAQALYLQAARLNIKVTRH